MRLGIALLLVLVMPLTACSSLGIGSQEAINAALCDGLREPVDTFADILLEHQRNTPAEVINGGTRVIRGYDAGCET